MRFPYTFSHLAVIALVLVLAASLNAQTVDTTGGTRWKIGIESSLGVAQAAYSDNWVGGESGSIVWVSSFRGTADKRLSYSLLFGNELKLEFGQTHTQIDSTKKWQSPKKSSDRILFNTILRLTRGWPVDPFAAGTLESQFVEITDTAKTYFNPVDLTEALGVARNIFNVPDKRVLTTRVGFGVRQHFVKNHETTNDGGIEWVTDFVLGSAKSRYSYASKFTAFQALYRAHQDQLPNDNWKTVDLNWDNALRANLTSVLQMSLNWQLLYDKEISTGGRFKEALALGLAYKFGTK